MKAMTPRMLVSRLGLVVTLLMTAACTNSKHHHVHELEMRKSFVNYLRSIEQLNEPGLANYVFFPNVKPRYYKSYVSNLLVEYLSQAQGGSVRFDDQGVVLSRFIRMTYHNYQVLYIQDIDERDTKMRISFGFSYDSLIRSANYLEGTRVFIPGEPWGKVHVYTVDGDNEIPRSQLKYIEVDVILRRTNFDGFYQIRKCLADPASAEYEESLLG